MKISYNRYYIVCAAVVNALYMIKNCHVDDAVEQINQSEYGAHHLVIYPDIRVLRQLYTKYVKKQLEDENIYTRIWKKSATLFSRTNQKE
jgi:hypothetical protein